MLPLNLSDADIETIKKEKNSHTCPSVRTRLLVLWMRHKGFSPGDTAVAADCHANSVTNIVKMYNDGGLVRILSVPTGSLKHPLADRFDQVRAKLKEATLHTLKQARQWLADNFDYHASKESTRKLLHRFGFRHLKVNPFPGNTKKLEEWLASQERWVKHLAFLHRKAQKGKIDMAFCDAAHFVYGKFCNFMWTDEPKYKATGSGRQRLNVYGAYDPVSGRVLTSHGEGSVDAEYVVGFLKWLRRYHYPDRKRKLHLMMDNARYQHCQFVKDAAKKLNIILEFQPSYSPNLNLIERVWKYIKGLVGRCYYSDKEQFFRAITDILVSTDDPIHQQKFTTLLTMKFQTYEQSQILG